MRKTSVRRFTSSRTLRRRLPMGAISLEASGFILIACTIWVNELLNLPHVLFGAPDSPFRPQEALLESALVLLLGVVVVGFTVHLVRHVDKLIVMCAWCHRIRLEDAWLSVEQFLLVHRAETSHGMCPDCAARLDTEIAGAA